MDKHKQKRGIFAKNYNELIEKVDNMKKQDKMDLSSDRDLSIAIMNLISIEEHFFFTGAKLKKPKYYSLLAEVREIRKEMLKEIITEYEGEVWCISKHLLAASMRLMEVGTKQLGMGNDKKAESLFEKAYNLYSLFWGLNMNIIDSKDISFASNNKEELKFIDLNDKDDKKQVKGKKSNIFIEKLGNFVKKAIDCCIE